ncbi:hypothetical protein GCM10028868_25590 [Virgibacillus kimchii]
MWIRGYKLKPGEVPPYYISEEIKRLVRNLANKYRVEFEASVHSEACYLIINELTISFRNHRPGKPNDYVIYLWKFNTWRQCEKYFEKRVAPLIGKI